MGDCSLAHLQRIAYSLPQTKEGALIVVLPYSWELPKFEVGLTPHRQVLGIQLSM